ncbi:Uncharacterised protein [Salmonella enterica subsp. enterica]|uniref:Uncharacterized protein n=1 Tax=Salmonella enterica I TaxID=59201 RepID=A0A379Y3V1_SALET|nr:Uncharacterised protein [Salmonella enterica subsp. enterica]
MIEENNSVTINFIVCKGLSNHLYVIIKSRLKNSVMK